MKYISYNDIKLWIRSLRKRDIVAFFTAFAFAIIFSIFSILQYYSLNISAYDLGINAQSLFSFLHTGSFYTSVLGENTLAQHFTIFKFVQLPIYYLFPSPVSIMVFEDIFIAMAGYVIYLISMHMFQGHIKSEKIIYALSIAFLLSYEFSPFSQGLVSFPFHNMAFLPFFFLLAFYAFLAEKRILHIVSLVFIISLHANFVYIAGILLLYEFLFLHTSRGNNIKMWFSKKSNSRGAKNFSYFIIILVLLYIYLIVAGMLKMYFAGVYAFSLSPPTKETGTAVSSPIGLIFLLFNNHSKFLAIIDTERANKIFYFNLLFKSNIYLPLFSPLSLIMTLPYIMYAVPSSYQSYYQLGYQYSAMVIGAMFISTIMGTYNIIRIAKYIQIHYKKFRKRDFKTSRTKYGEPAGIAIIIIIIIIVFIIAMPYGILLPVSEQNTTYSTMQDIHKEIPNGAVSFLINISNHIPEKSYILTGNGLMPYFSNHLYVYAAAFSPGYYNNLSKFQYIVIENNSFWSIQGGQNSLQNIVNMELKNGNYTVIDEYKPQSILVLKKA